MTSHGDDRTQRTQLIRLRRKTFGALAADEREALIDRLYTIFSTYFAGHDRETFAQIALPTPETRLGLLYTAEGEIAGFASNYIQRLIIDGRPQAAMSASGFILPGYRGGTLAAFFTLGEALRFTLRHPTTPLGYLGAVHGPTVYQRFAYSFERIYPNRRDGFPPEIAEVAQIFSEGRGLPVEGPPPWVLSLGIRPLRTAPLTPARAKDPDVQYFCALNPGYTAGESLLVWIPLDRANLGRVFLSLSRDGGAEALNWIRGRGRGGARQP